MGLKKRIIKAIGKPFGYPRLTAQERAHLTATPLKYPGRPICYFEWGKNDLRRSLYTFLKFFDLAGFNVQIKDDKHLLAEIKGDTYAQLLLQENWLHLVKEEGAADFKFSFLRKPGVVTISDDYFNKKNHSFRVPITMHPVMYARGYWDEDITPPSTRNKSVFFAGNFRADTYMRIKKDQLFDVLIRTELMSLLKKGTSLKEIKELEQLESAFEEEVVIVNTDPTDRGLLIPIQELRGIMAKFSFFLAAPGASVPLSHNLAESMSAGCIPIIQKHYAELVDPPLKDQTNAIFFEDKDDFIPKIREALQAGDAVIDQMRSEVMAYYDQHMRPEAVIRKITEDKYADLQLLSFSSSIQYLKRK